MSKLFTVVEKSQVLALLNQSELPKVINNIGYSKSCTETIFTTAEDSFFDLQNILPCIWCEYKDFAEALTERFPINWQTHMYLMLDVDEDRVFNLQHNTLLELSALPEPCTTEETIQYQKLLVNSITNELKLGISKDVYAMNFVTGVQVADIAGFLILDEDFDPHEDTNVKMTADVSLKNLEQAVKSSVF